MGKIINQRLLFIMVDQVLNDKEAVAMVRCYNYVGMMIK